jgi:hypothetical protein
MKKIFTIILLLIAFRAIGQDSLTVYNYMRNKIVINGSVFLGGWAVTNIAVGIGGAIVTQGGTQPHYFYQMTAIWNVANLGAAVYGYTIANDSQNRLTADASAIAQRRINRTFLLNGALDIGYIGIGTLIDHKGNSQHSAIKQGYGTAIMGQGVFLLVYDVTMFALEKHNSTGLMKIVGKNQLSFDGHRVGITIHI